MIHIGRESTNLGTFSEEDVRQGLASGRFLRTDLGWKEGMANWQPLSTFAELAEAPPLPPGLGENAPAVLTEVPALDGRVGLPWEHRHQMGNFHAFYETLKMVLLNPTEAFARMRTSGGLKEPLMYAIAGGWPAVVVALAFQFLLALAGSSASQFTGNPITSTPERAVGALLLIALLWPLLALLAAYIGSFVTHVCLLLVGGANRPFEATMRVLCFSFGSAQCFQVIPGCGGFIGGVWQIVCVTIGLSKVHEISVLRALAAVLLPIIVCCGAALLIAISMPALLQQAQHGGFR